MIPSFGLDDYNLTAPKIGAHQAMKQFVKDNTQLIQANSIDNNQYHSALTTIFILSWQQNQNHPLVLSKLSGFQFSKEVDACLDIISIRSMEGAFKQLQACIPLINDFRQKFTVDELEQILEKNKEHLIVIGQFKQTGKKGKNKKVELIKRIGNDRAEKAMIVVRNASTRDDKWVYIIYCMSAKQHLEDQRMEKELEERRSRGEDIRKISRKEEKVEDRGKKVTTTTTTTTTRTSSTSSPSKQEFRGSHTSNSSQTKTDIRISANSQQHSPRHRQSSQQDPNSPRSPIASPRAPPGTLDLSKQTPCSNFCQDCQNYRLIDSQNKKCWQCWKKDSSKQNYINVLWYAIFFVVVVFLVLLNCHHAREGKQRRDQIVDNAARHSYEAIFTRHQELDTHSRTYYHE